MLSMRYNILEDKMSENETVTTEPSETSKAGQNEIQPEVVAEKKAYFRNRNRRVAAGRLDCWSVLPRKS